MATKKEEAKATPKERIKKASVKEKAKKYLARQSAARVHPVTYEALLMAYSAVGFLKYDEALEAADNYREEYMKNIKPEDK